MWSLVKLPKPESKYDRIAFCGPMASGKTFLANHLVNDYHYTKYSFAAKLKAVAYELYGVAEKTGETRELLQKLGEQLRSHDPDVWIKYLVAQVGQGINNKVTHVVIDDLRYVNEAKVLKDSGFFIVKVTTSEEVRRQRVSSLYPDTRFDSASEHPSEREWESINADIEIESNNHVALHTLDEILLHAKTATYR